MPSQLASACWLGYAWGMDTHDRIVQGLVTSWRQAGQAVDVVQTHISTVLLAGDYAYKLKKPVSLPFLDFSTLALREKFCREECRINSRLAPALYLGVLPVRGTLEAPVLDRGDAGVTVLPLLDWVVCMRRFANDDLLASRAVRGCLQAADVDALADHLADFHTSLPSVPPSLLKEKEVIDWAEESLIELQDLAHAEGCVGDDRLHAVRDALLSNFRKIEGWLHQRRCDGWVREGHGDLHLGNVVLTESGVLAFDAIEFDPGLRRIDVMNDVAFAFMDLLAYGLAALAWRFINRYVEQTGDYDGLRGLKTYAAYRAVVRAKVCLLAGTPDEAMRYWQTAEHLLVVPGQGRLVLTMGLSGSGKTTVAQMLLEGLADQGEGCVRVRSDVERKRLVGMRAGVRPSREQIRQLYALKTTMQTYMRLKTLAEALLRAGFSVVLDAAFLRQDEREAMLHVAERWAGDFAIVECLAPRDCLSQRLRKRELEGKDASDATPAVMMRQMGFTEPVPITWGAVHWTVLNDGDMDHLRRTVAPLLHHWDVEGNPVQK